MFQSNLNFYQNMPTPGNDKSGGMYARQYNAALNQFKAALLKGKLSCLTRKILHRPHELLDLNDLKSNLTVRGSFYSGIQVVRIHLIIGSESRATDFDMEFHPINETSRERWVNMAILYLSRLPLPPIQLIQVGDAYFVRDGHHRISVSRAFGQVAMDAEVITWKVQHPFPLPTSMVQKEHYSWKSFHLST